MDSEAEHCLAVDLSVETLGWEEGAGTLDREATLEDRFPDVDQALFRAETFSKALLGAWEVGIEVMGLLATDMVVEGIIAVVGVDSSKLPRSRVRRCDCADLRTVVHRMQTTFPVLRRATGTAVAAAGHLEARIVRQTVRAGMEQGMGTTATPSGRGIEKEDDEKGGRVYTSSLAHSRTDQPVCAPCEVWSVSPKKVKYVLFCCMCIIIKFVPQWYGKACPFPASQELRLMISCGMPE